MNEGVVLVDKDGNPIVRVKKIVEGFDELFKEIDTKNDIQTRSKQKP